MSWSLTCQIEGLALHVLPHQKLDGLAFHIRLPFTGAANVGQGGPETRPAGCSSRRQRRWRRASVCAGGAGRQSRARLHRLRGGRLAGEASKGQQIVKRPECDLCDMLCWWHEPPGLRGCMTLEMLNWQVESQKRHTDGKRTLRPRFRQKPQSPDNLQLCLLTA